MTDNDGSARDGDTPYGFVWGPLFVERLATLPNERRVLRVRTRRQTLEVHITRSGLFRIYRLNQQVWP